MLTMIFLVTSCGCTEMYPENWDMIAYITKELAGWKCERCGHSHDPKAGYTLTVHHIDGVEENCRDDNLIALCQRCHLRSQHYTKVIEFGQLGFIWQREGVINETYF